MTMDHGQFTQKADITQTIEPLDRSDGMTWKNPATGELRMWDATNNRWLIIENNPKIFDKYQKGITVSGALASDGSVLTACTALLFPTVSFEADNREVSGRKYASATSSSEKGFVLSGTLLEIMSFDSSNSVEEAAIATTKPVASASASSSSTGYYAGGTGSAQITDIDFASVTVGLLIDELTAPRDFCCGVNSPESCYVFGGRNSYGSNIGFVEKLSYADASVTALSAKQDVATARACCFNSTLVGYSVGGVYTDGTKTSTIDEFSFANETEFVSCSSITSATHVSASGVNSTTSGYSVSGFDTATCSNVTFSDGSVGQISDQLTEPVFGSAAFDSTDNNGYIN